MEIYCFFSPFQRIYHKMTMAFWNLKDCTSLGKRQCSRSFVNAHSLTTAQCLGSGSGSGSGSLSLTEIFG